MGLLSDFFIANAEQAVCYPEQPLAKTDVAAFGGLTILEVSTLWAIAEGQPWSEALLDAFECVREVDDGEMLVHRLPQPFVTLLARLDVASAQAAAEEWAGTEELAYRNASPDDAREIIDAMAQLAQRVELDPAKSLYFFMSV